MLERHHAVDEGSDMNLGAGASDAAVQERRRENVIQRRHVTSETSSDRNTGSASATMQEEHQKGGFQKRNHGGRPDRTLQPAAATVQQNHMHASREDLTGLSETGARMGCTDETVRGTFRGRSKPREESADRVSVVDMCFYVCVCVCGFFLVCVFMCVF